MLRWQSAAKAGKVVSLEAVRHGRQERSVGDIVDLMGTQVKFDRNAEIFGEGEPAEHLYKVVSGAVRISKLMSDGRRQIGAFYMPGSIFGLEAEDVHHFSAEAVTDSSILAVNRRTFLAEVTRDCALAGQLWAEAMQHLQRAQEHMLLLGRKSAQERIAAFLLDMAGCLSRQGAVELPMSRQDIADYLGLTIETVSRTLTQLERDGIIAIPVSRRILLRDPAALGQMNDCLAA
jgi:CRP/FNR family transcriptional regulator, nitrogen fixation regulation protein